jgi:hypothetical protein
MDLEESSNLQGKMEWQHDFSKMFKNGTTDYRPEQQPCKFTVATSVTIMQIHSNNHANSQ